MTQRVGKKALEEAITRVTHLSPRPTVQAQIIEMGANAWAQGITPELMNVFGKIASTMRVTRLDMNRLATHGINPLPLYEDVKRQAARDPWLDAGHDEIWDIEIDGETILCRSDSDGDFTPIFGHQHWAKIANGSDRITAGRRVWPEGEKK